MSEISAFQTTTSSSAAYDNSYTSTEKDAVTKGREKAAALASVTLTISPEALERMKQDAQQQSSQAPTKEESEKMLKPVLEARNIYLQGIDSRTPSLDHPLYSSPSSSAEVTDFRQFFALAEGGTKESTTALADALYDAVSSPLNGGTDSTEIVDIALIREKLEYINSKYIPAEHQAETSKDIDAFITRRLNEHNETTRTMLNAELNVAQSLGDSGRTKEAQANIDAFNAGNYRTQQESQQVLALTHGAQSSEELVNGLTQWYASLDGRYDGQDAQFDTLIASWQQFAEKYA